MSKIEIMEPTHGEKNTITTNRDDKEEHTIGGPATAAPPPRAEPHLGPKCQFANGSTRAIGTKPGRFLTSSKTNKSPWRLSRPQKRT